MGTAGLEIQLDFVVNIILLMGRLDNRNLGLSRLFLGLGTLLALLNYGASRLTTG
jgi:hypothetical protein